MSAVHEGIAAAQETLPVRRPWVMISVNDDEDLHFRKAGSLTSFLGFQDKVHNWIPKLNTQFTVLCALMCVNRVRSRGMPG